MDQPAEECCVCGGDHATESCPQLIEEESTEVNPSRAELTLPIEWELVTEEDGATKVVAKKDIPVKSRLGPYEARRTTNEVATENVFIIKVFLKDGSSVSLLTDNENECNWLCLVPTATAARKQNCMAVQLGMDIFYLTTKKISEGEALQVWYAPHYARKLGKSPEPDGCTHTMLQYSRMSPTAPGHKILIQPAEDILEQVAEMGDITTSLPGPEENTTATVTSVKPAIKPDLDGKDTYQPDTSHLRDYIKYEELTKAKNKEFPCNDCSAVFVTNYLLEQHRFSSHKDCDDVGESPSSPPEPVTRNERVNYNEGDTHKCLRCTAVFDSSRDLAVHVREHLSAECHQWKKRRRGRKSKAEILLQQRLHTEGDSAEILPMPDEAAEEENPEGANTDSSVIDVKPEVEVPKPPPKRKVGRPRKQDKKNDPPSTSEDKKDVKAGSEDVILVPSDSENYCPKCGHTFKRRATLIRHVCLAKSPVKTTKEAKNNVPKVTSPEPDDIASEVSATDEEYSPPKKKRRGRPPSLLKKPKEFPCPKCEQTFKGRHYMLNHLKVHAKCDECNVQFPTMNAFENHICSTEVSGFKCKICEKVIETSHRFSLHVNSHTTTRKCHLCQKEFSSAKSLKAHGCPQALVRATDDGESPSVFYCEFCGLEFENKKYLYRHMSTHTGDFTCSTCEKTFCRKESLLSHMIECNPEGLEGNDGGKKYYPCKECKKVFSKLKTYEKHIKIHVVPVKCDECETNFASEAAMKKHICGRTEDAETMISCYCEYCGRGFIKEIYLVRHLGIHTGQHTCSICSKVLCRKEELQKHMVKCLASVTVEKSGNIQCSVCKMEFFNPDEFTQHYRTHTHPYQCEKCKKSFMRKNAFTNHKCTFWDGQPVQCDICLKKYCSPTYLARHKKIHDPAFTKCTKCKKTFKPGTNSLTHTCIDEKGNEIRVKTRKFNKHKFITTKREPVVCHTCGCSFVSVSNLNKHMLTHGDKREICEICGKKFHLKTALRVHMDSHSVTPRHECQVCGKKLRTVHSLYVHMKHMHDQNYEGHKCDKCGRTFKQKGNMLKHMLTHSDKRQFGCPLCTKGFKVKEQLNRHLVWHKYGERYACMFCDKKFVMNHEVKKHIKMYHEGYIHKCPFCKIESRHPNTLKKHFERRHQDIQQWKVNTEDFINKCIVYGDMHGDAPHTYSKPSGGASGSEVRETTFILTTSGQSDDQEGSGQTFVIQGDDPNLLSKQVTDALQSLTSQGLLEPDQDATISIIGDIQSATGQSVPIAFQNPTNTGEEGYIIVPVVKSENQSQSTAQETATTNQDSHNLNTVASIEQTLSSVSSSNEVNNPSDSAATCLLMPDGRQVQVVSEVGSTPSVAFTQAHIMTGSDQIHNSTPHLVTASQQEYSNAQLLPEGQRVTPQNEQGDQTTLVYLQETHSGNDGAQLQVIEGTTIDAGIDSERLTQQGGGRVQEIEDIDVAQVLLQASQVVQE